MNEIVIYTNLALAVLTIIIYSTNIVEHSNFRGRVIGANLFMIVVSVVLFLINDGATFSTLIKTLSISIYMILLVTYDLTVNRLRHILIWSFLVCATVLISGLILG